MTTTSARTALAAATSVAVLFAIAVDQPKALQVFRWTLGAVVLLAVVASVGAVIAAWSGYSFREGQR